MQSLQTSLIRYNFTAVIEMKMLTFFQKNLNMVKNKRPSYPIAKVATCCLLKNEESKIKILNKKFIKKVNIYSVIFFK